MHRGHGETEAVPVPNLQQVEQQSQTHNEQQNMALRTRTLFGKNESIRARALELERCLRFPLWRQDSHVASRLTCLYAAGFGTQVGQVDVGLPAVDYGVGVLAGSLRGSPVRHRHLTWKQARQRSANLIARNRLVENKPKHRNVFGIPDGVGAKTPRPDKINSIYTTWSFAVSVAVQKKQSGESASAARPIGSHV